MPDDRFIIRLNTVPITRIENVTFSYHTCVSCFAHDVGLEQALGNVSYCDITFSVRIEYTDIFLNRLFQFCSNNATNLQPLNFAQHVVLPHNIEIVM